VRLLFTLALLALACVPAGAQAPIQISVSPASCTLVGGGSCTFTVTANRSWANFVITGKPIWLSTNSTARRTPATIVYTVVPNVAPGSYEATLRFQNVSTPSQPAVARTVKLTVAAPPPPQGSWNLTVTPAPGHYTSAGDLLTWQYVVTNTGTTQITAIGVTGRPGPAACPFLSLDAGQQMLCSNQQSATQADITAGSIVNSAAATGTGAPSASATGTATYVPPSGLSYLLDAQGGKLCTSDTCADFLVAQ